MIGNEAAVWNVLEEKSAAHRLLDVTVPDDEVEHEVGQWNVEGNDHLSLMSLQDN